MESGTGGRPSWTRIKHGQISTKISKSSAGCVSRRSNEARRGSYLADSGSSGARATGAAIVSRLRATHRIEPQRRHRGSALPKWLLLRLVLLGFGAGRGWPTGR